MHLFNTSTHTIISTWLDIILDSGSRSYVIQNSWGVHSRGRGGRVEEDGGPVPADGGPVTAVPPGSYGGTPSAAGVYMPCFFWSSRSSFHRVLTPSIMTWTS